MQVLRLQNTFPNLAFCTYCILSRGQGRSVGGYIGIGLYTPKSVNLKFFMWLFCLLDPGQIRYRAIYTHPNQIPGYATFPNLAFCTYCILSRGQGRSDGGYIGIYTPKSVNLKFFYVVVLSP